MPLLRTIIEVEDEAMTDTTESWNFTAVGCNPNDGPLRGDIN
jgi:hypothetical protein